MSTLGWIALEMIVSASIVLLVISVVVEVIIGVNCLRLLDAFQLMGKPGRPEPNLCDIMQASRGGAAGPERGNVRTLVSPQPRVPSRRRGS